MLSGMGIREGQMNQEQFIKIMADSKLYDLTQGCSIFTPPWPGEKSLEIHFFKRVLSDMYEK